MSMIPSHTNGAVTTLSQLTAQAGPTGSRADVRSEAATARYDINAIAQSERGLEMARMDDVRELVQYDRRTSQRQKISEATERAILRHKKRAENMSNALVRLGAGPLAEGQRILSLFSRGGNRAVHINTTGQVDSLYLRGGDQALSIKSKTATIINTGGGHDAVAIEADFVRSVYTDRSGQHELAYRKNGEKYARWAPKTVSNDAVAIKARFAESIYTKGGADAISIMADSIRSVYAGEGQDAIALTGGIISGIHGEDGDDSITVQAAIGGSVTRNLAFASRTYLTGEGYDYVRPDSAKERMRLAITNYSDVHGGDGDDEISVSVQEIISIDGGSGNDVISVEGGTVGLRVNASSGNDVVRVARGAELMIQVDHGGYIVEKSDNDLIVRHSGGVVRIEGYEQAAAISVAGNGDGIKYSDLYPDSAEARREAAQKEELEQFFRTAEKIKMPELDARLSEAMANIKEVKSHGFQMVHVANPQTLDVTA